MAVAAGVCWTPALSAKMVGVNIIVNGEARQASVPLTVAQLLSDLQLSPRGVAVEVNLQIVPRAEHERFELRDGDRLEVVTLVGGG